MSRPAAVPVPDSAGFARSLPSLHQLLPEYACIETPDGLVKTTETEIPELRTDMIADAMRFHQELDEAWSDRYDLHPIVGFRQPTKTTARIADGRVEPLYTIMDNDEGGDATVPRLSATPAKFRPDDPAVRSAAERHGSLQSNRSVLDELEFVLGARRQVCRAGGETQLSVSLDELAVAGEPIVVTATPADGSRTKLQAIARDESGREVSTVVLDPGRPGAIEPLAPGGYQITVQGVGTAVTRVAPVTCPILVWGGEDD